MDDHERTENSEPTAAKQQGDVHALDREDDPRGGVQNEEYRTADPRELVEEDGVTMSGLGKGEGGLWRRVIAGQKPAGIAGRGG